MLFLVLNSGSFRKLSTSFHKQLFFFTPGNISAASQVCARKNPRLFVLNLTASIWYFGKTLALNYGRYFHLENELYLLLRYVKTHFSNPDMVQTDNGCNTNKMVGILWKAFIIMQILLANIKITHGYRGSSVSSIALLYICADDSREPTRGGIPYELA